MLISALLGSLGTASVIAQNVYSLNTVGYINVSLVAGFNIITIPLVTATDTNGSYNTIGDLFPNGPGTGNPYDSDQIFILPPGATGYISTLGKSTGSAAATGWTASAGQASSTNQLLPGTAIWYERGNSAGTTNVIVVGTVTNGPVTNPIVAGFNLVGSMVPLVGDLYSNAVAGNNGTNGWTNVNGGDQVELFDANAQNFVGTYLDNAPAPSGNGSSPWKAIHGGSGDPIISNAYEGFFYVAGSPISWVENYSATQP